MGLAVRRIGLQPDVAKPAWQHDNGCLNRTETDVSAVADPLTGVAIYDSYSICCQTLVVGSYTAARALPHQSLPHFMRSPATPLRKMLRRISGKQKALFSLTLSPGPQTVLASKGISARRAWATMGLPDGAPPTDWARFKPNGLLNRDRRTHNASDSREMCQAFETRFARRQSRATAQSPRPHLARATTTDDNGRRELTRTRTLRTAPHPFISYKFHYLRVKFGFWRLRWPRSLALDDDERLARASGGRLQRHPPKPSCWPKGDSSSNAPGWDDVRLPAFFLLGRRR